MEVYRSGHNEAVLKFQSAARRCKTATSERGSKHAVFETVKYLLEMISIENSKGEKNVGKHNLIVNTEGYRSGHNEAVLKTRA